MTLQTSDISTIIAFIGGVAAPAMNVAGDSSKNKIVERLAELPEEALIATKGSITFEVEQLSAIVYKKKVLSSSEIIFHQNNGAEKMFGIMNAIDQPFIVSALTDLYGQIVLSQ
ncbi:MAG: hypothetical protein A2341_27230 [Deltaproteobacteria bacterium RIFOXYB12_FULL_58_9]|nr:MAG: hypothetical protein A2341_27230 [Deltaproteobacteria bacterium RIFOXYB12_FULL_58_9]